MSNLFLILVIAFVIIVFAIALLAIGWLITGKTKIQKTDDHDPIIEKVDLSQPSKDCSTSQKSVHHEENS